MREGYKKTKIGWIPDDWEYCKIKGISTKVTDGEHATPIREEKGYYLLSARNILDNKISLANVDYVGEAEYNRIIKRCNPECNDIVISCSGTIGRVAVVPENLKFVMVRSAALIKLKQAEVNSEFIKSAIQSYKVQKLILRTLNQGAQANLFINHIESLIIPLPPLPEQQKIAQILSTWDKSIETVEKLIAAKSKLKKGLMQKLLTEKLRFKKFNEEKWKEIHLKDVLENVTRPIDKPQQKYHALGIRSHGKGTFIREVENPEKVMMDTLYQVKENDLIVNITFAWEGAIAIVKKSDEGCLVSHRFPTYIFKKSKVVSDFFRQIIITKSFVFKLGLISPGGAGRNRVLNKKDFLNLKLNFPSVKEQQKIASVLSSADKEIELLNKKLDTFKQQKKGLMQKLLTGQVRVRV